MVAFRGTQAPRGKEQAPLGPVDQSATQPQAPDLEPYRRARAQEAQKGQGFPQLGMRAALVAGGAVAGGLGILTAEIASGQATAHAEGRHVDTQSPTSALPATISANSPEAVGLTGIPGDATGPLVNQRVIREETKLQKEFNAAVAAAIKVNQANRAEIDQYLETPHFQNTPNFELTQLPAGVHEQQLQRDGSYQFLDITGVALQAVPAGYSLGNDGEYHLMFYNGVRFQKPDGTFGEIWYSPSQGDWNKGVLEGYVGINNTPVSIDAGTFNEKWNIAASNKGLVTLVFPEENLTLHGKITTPSATGLRDYLFNPATHKAPAGVVDSLTPSNYASLSPTKLQVPYYSNLE